MWVLLLGTMCRAIVGSHEKGCHQIFNVTLCDLPLRSSGPVCDLGGWQKCWRKERMVKANAGIHRNRNLQLPHRSVGIGTREDLKETVPGDPDLRAAVSGRLQRCPWSLHRF